MPPPRSIVPASSDTTLITETEARSLSPEPARPTHLGPASPSLHNITTTRTVARRNPSCARIPYQLRATQCGNEKISANPIAAPESPRPNTRVLPRLRPATRGASPPVHGAAFAGPRRHHLPCGRCAAARAHAAWPQPRSVPLPGAPSASSYRPGTRGASVECPCTDAALSLSAVQTGRFGDFPSPRHFRNPRDHVSPKVRISATARSSATTRSVGQTHPCGAQASNAVRRRFAANCGRLELVRELNTMDSPGPRLSADGEAVGTAAPCVRDAGSRPGSAC